jgi:hypothetical protein
MKWNFSVVKKFIMKNKLVLLFVLFILLFISFMPFRESFSDLNSTTDPYKYLAPVPKGNTWSQTTINDFTNKFNTVNSTQNSGEVAAQINPSYLNYIMSNALEEEAQYYIQNGKFFLDSYVTDYLTKNPVIRFDKPYTIDQLSAMGPNRLIYGQFLSRAELQQSPQPLSYQIYSGITPPPTSNTVTTTPSSNTVSTTPSSNTVTTTTSSNTVTTTPKTTTVTQPINITSPISIENNNNKLLGNCYSVKDQEKCENSINAKGNKCFWRDSKKNKGSLCYSPLSN